MDDDAAADAILKLLQQGIDLCNASEQHRFRCHHLATQFATLWTAAQHTPHPKVPHQAFASVSTLPYGLATTLSLPLTSQQSSFVSWAVVAQATLAQIVAGLPYAIVDPDDLSVPADARGSQRMLQQSGSGHGSDDEDTVENYGAGFGKGKAKSHSQNRGSRNSAMQAIGDPFEQWGYALTWLLALHPYEGNPVPSNSQANASEPDHPLQYAARRARDITRAQATTRKPTHSLIRSFDAQLSTLWPHQVPIAELKLGLRFIDAPQDSAPADPQIQIQCPATISALWGEAPIAIRIVPLHTLVGVAPLLMAFRYVAGRQAATSTGSSENSKQSAISTSSHNADSAKLLTPIYGLSYIHSPAPRLLIVTPVAPLGSLANRLGRPIPPQEALPILLDVIHALCFIRTLSFAQYADIASAVDTNSQPTTNTPTHGKESCHGNLAPENILIFPEGCKLADFALDFFPRKTHASYEAPERKKLSPPFIGDSGQALDAYAFGALICHVLSGSPVMQKFIPELQHPYAATIAACTDKDPKMRPNLQYLCKLIEVEHDKLFHPEKQAAQQQQHQQQQFQQQQQEYTERQPHEESPPPAHPQPPAEDLLQVSIDQHRELSQISNSRRQDTPSKLIKPASEVRSTANWMADSYKPAGRSASFSNFFSSSKKAQQSPLSSSSFSSTTQSGESDRKTPGPQQTSGATQLRPSSPSVGSVDSKRANPILSLSPDMQHQRRLQGSLSATEAGAYTSPTLSPTSSFSSIPPQAARKDSFSHLTQASVGTPSRTNSNHALSSDPTGNMQPPHQVRLMDPTSLTAFLSSIGMDQVVIDRIGTHAINGSNFLSMSSDLFARPPYKFDAYQVKVIHETQNRIKAFRSPASSPPHTENSIHSSSRSESPAIPQRSTSPITDELSPVGAVGTGLVAQMSRSFSASRISAPSSTTRGSLTPSSGAAHRPAANSWQQQQQQQQQQQSQTQQPAFGLNAPARPSLATSQETTLSTIQRSSLSIVTVSADLTARVWDSHTLDQQKLLMGHDAQVRCVGLCQGPASGSRQSETMVVTGCDDAMVRIWSKDSVHPKMVLKGHTSSVSALAWVEQERFLVSGGYDKAVHLWNVETGTAAGIIHGHSAAIYSMTTMSNGCVATGCSVYNPVVRVWDLSEARQSHELYGHVGNIYALLSLGHAPFQHTLFSASGTHYLNQPDNVVRAWDLRTGAQEFELSGHKGWITAMSRGATTDLLLTGSADKTLRIWDLRTRKVLTALGLFSAPIASLASDADVQYMKTAGTSEFQCYVAHTLAVATQDGFLRVFDMSSAGTPLLTKESRLHADKIWAATFVDA